MSEHFRSPNDEWDWWRRVVIRGAGMPAVEVSTLVDEELACRAQRQAASYLDEFDSSDAELTRRLKASARDPWFRSAVTLQNHHAAMGALDPYLAWDPAVEPKRSLHRRQENLIASYLQRFSVKNDTIGYFGPVGWARIGTAEVSHLSAGRAPGVHSPGSLFFEHWAIERLATVMNELPGLKEWLCPRWLPYIWVRGQTLTRAAGPPIQLSEDEAALLRLCDGHTCARDIAGVLAVDMSTASMMLDDLRARRWINWRIELPATPWPERALRDRLAGVGDPAVRDQALGLLRRLELVRDEVRSVMADPVRLGAALRKLDATFTDLTGAAPTRSPGQTYGGRTLVYLDCRRELTLTLGRDFLQAAEPLNALAGSARWYCWQVGNEARSILQKVHETRGDVDLITFTLAALGPLRRGLHRVVSGVQKEFTRKWAEILALDLDAHRCNYSLDEISPRVSGAFAAPAPGWDGARYFSPDVMVAGRTIESLATDAQLVLGEAHMAVNTQRPWLFRSQLPTGEDPLSPIDVDYPEPRLLPIAPQQWSSSVSARLQDSLIRKEDILVDLAYQAPSSERSRLVSGRDVQVQLDGDELVVRLPDGTVFDILEPFSEVLLDVVVDKFRLFPDQPHIPRITIDRLVAVRETWRLSSNTLAFARDQSVPSRFAQANLWRRSFGIPRHVFASVPGRKPIFVDFSSCPLVNLLARIVRTCRADTVITFSEMLPGLQDLWLTDEDDQRYTAELRLVLVDRFTGKHVKSSGNCKTETAQ